MSRMRTWALFALLLAFTASDEVKELDAVSADVSLRAAEASKDKAGGFFSALMTSGSMTMMQAGSFEEEESATKAELGEAKPQIENDLEGKIAQLQAQPAAAQHQQDRSDIGESAKEEEDAGFGSDWLKCKSEGGTKECAMCDTGGGLLPCSAVTAKKPHSKSSACPDDKVLQTRKFFHQWGRKGGMGVCHGLDSSSALNQFDYTSYSFPRIATSHISAFDTQLKGNAVITKKAVLRPMGATRNVGVIVVKRMVTHKCIGTNPGGCRAGDTVFDTFKRGFCVKCPEAKYNRQGCGDKCQLFTTHGGYAPDDEKIAFVQQCLPNAVDAATGELKDEYRCNDSDGKGNDITAAKASIAAF